MKSSIDELFASRWQFLPKRAFDLFLSGVGLVVSSPMWAVIAAAIVLDDGLPVFYRQKRWGRGGHAFTAFKFRSMRVSHPEERSVQAKADDPRVTRVGKLLRATAMDELPQIWNIFRGDMSFVGPRALPINEIQSGPQDSNVPDDAVPGFWDRLAVQPGLTGIAQIFADRDVPRACKFRYDLLYIRRRSFRLDLRLIAVSFYISFLGRWERRGAKVAANRVQVHSEKDSGV